MAHHISVVFPERELAVWYGSHPIKTEALTRWSRDKQKVRRVLIYKVDTLSSVLQLSLLLSIKPMSDLTGLIKQTKPDTKGNIVVRCWLSNQTNDL